MLNATRYAKAAISLLLFFEVSGYPLSIVNGDTVVNKGSCPSSLVMSATSGYEMYTVYCAGCHGEDGRGNGRSSRYCTVPPVDLTQLSTKNHDIYPSESVCRILRYGTGRPSQGAGLHAYMGTSLRVHECRLAGGDGSAHSESLRVRKDSAEPSGRSTEASDGR